MGSCSMKFHVNGQILRREDSKRIVGGSKKYLTAKFTFSKDWSDRVEEVIDEVSEQPIERLTHVIKTVIFSQVTTGFSVKRVLNAENEITAQMELELIPGLYEVTVQGSTPEPLTGYAERPDDGIFIVTSPERIRVEPSTYSLTGGGHCFGEVTTPLSLKPLDCCSHDGISPDGKFVQQLVDMAEVAISVKNAADRGDFTPVAGEDYWTDEDKRNILGQAIETIRDDGLELLIKTASTEDLGIVRVGEGLTISEEGVLSVDVIDDSEVSSDKSWSSEKTAEEIQANSDKIDAIEEVLGLEDESSEETISARISALEAGLSDESDERKSSDQELSEKLTVVETDLYGSETPKVVGIKSRLKTTEDCLNREIMNRRSAVTALDSRVLAVESKLAGAIYDVAAEVNAAREAAIAASQDADHCKQETAQLCQDAVTEITEISDSAATTIENLVASAEERISTSESTAVTGINTAKEAAIAEVQDSVNSLAEKESESITNIQTQEATSIEAVAAEGATQQTKLVEKADEQLDRIPVVTEMKSELDEFKENLVLVTDDQPTSDHNRLWLKQTPLAPIDLATPGDLGLLVEVNKAADYLYELNYNILDYDYAKTYFLSKKPISVGGCSSARFGNFYGRNLDWTYDNNVEFVIKTPANNDFHGTIGVSGPITVLTRELVESRTYDEAYKIVPFMLADGINDAGVICNTNVVPVEKGITTGTTPTSTKADEICSLMLPRYILDRFSTAADAVDYLQKHVSVYVPATLHNMGYETHLMIADKNDTYVIEFVDNSIKIIPANDYPFMTNFHLHEVIRNSDGSVYTPETQTSSANAALTNNITAHGSGLERYNLINANKSTANTKSGMRALLDKLLYSNTYKRSTSPFWYTEYVGTNTVSSPANNFEEIIGHYISYFNDRERGDGRTWHTTHSAIYDIAAKTLYLRSQEGSEEFEYKFNYLTASDFTVSRTSLETVLDAVFNGGD